MAEKDATVRLRRAVQENNLFLVKRLIKRTGDMRNPDPTHKRFTSLAWAAVLGNEETFEYLLNAGHDEEEHSRDSEDSTILIQLAEAKPPLTASYSCGQTEQEFYGATLRMARLYYDRYPDTLDWANADGKTALHMAAERGNEELVRMLCSLNADYDLADNEGNTPLHYASAWGHIPIVQLLIERGCQYNVRNNDGFTPSDYAYSSVLFTKDVLQDTARAQFEMNKKARRNVFAQAAARGNEWGSANTPIPPVPPRLSNGSVPRMVNSSMRMRSGSGTSRTTTTSDSGDWNESYTGTSQSQSQSRSNTLAPSAASSLSPPRNGVPLPATQTGALSAAQSAAAANGLSPIASRMRAVDAEAMEKYKLRQRSGSAATASTDAPSQNGSGLSSHGPSEEEMTSLHSFATVGSVAPRRRLRPSASAAQLRSPPQPPSSTSSSAIHQETRARNGSSPGILKRHPSLSSATSLATSSKESTPTTPTQSISRTFASSRPSLSSEMREKEKEFMGPSAEYAKFPPPPAAPPQPPEKDSRDRDRVESSGREKEKSTTPTSAYTRRIPFFSSHKHSADREREREKEREKEREREREKEREREQHHGFGGHKRNTSAQSLQPRVT
ncbi:hypothetical protein BC629DRAFT_1286622 [Irpex lacteus]|nr:hypothetical protein BC629DRAFT_1286622 [Irpex lacteus]